jgi:hypothetical protein
MIATNGLHGGSSPGDRLGGPGAINLCIDRFALSYGCNMDNDHLTKFINFITVSGVGKVCHDDL